MDKAKEEGVLGTIADAAKTSIDAAVEGVSSAASAIAAPSLAQQKSPEGGEDVRPPRKLRLAGEGRVGAEKRRDPGQGKLLLPLPLPRAHERRRGQHARRSGAPRNLAEPSLGVPPGVAHAD